MSPDGAPLVSAIIPAYNAEAFLATAIESALAQTYEPLEIIVVDDGSTDGTRDIVRTFMRREPTRVSMHQHPAGQNRGTGSTRNLGVTVARGEYVAFLDADDRWYPTKLERQVDVMRRDADAAVCLTRARVVRRGGSPDWLDAAEFVGDEPVADRREAVWRIASGAFMYIFSTALVRRATFCAVGGFPERLPFQSEDRIALAKLSAVAGVRLVPEVLCDYVMHAASYSAQALRMGPAITFDLQVRVARWLIEDSARPEWGWMILRWMAPATARRALLSCRRPRLLSNVAANGALAAFLLARCLLHRLRRVDPGRTFR